MRIGLIGTGDVTDPTFWSGVAAGLVGGLREAGATPVAINAQLPGFYHVAGRVGLPWTFEITNPAMVAAASARARAAIAATGRLDGLVLVGCSLPLRTRLPVATFDDLTVAQAARRGEYGLGALEARTVARWRARQGRVYAGATACCVATRPTAASVREDYGVASERVHVVGFGRNFDPPAGVGARDWRVPRLLFVGIDWERKRGAATLEAFAAVRAAHPDATLDVVGGHPAMEAPPGVRLHGPLALRRPAERATLQRLFATATCFVMPSAYEGFGIAYLDAGAAGVPSVGTTAGGAPDAVGPGGILVDPGDADALVAAMLRLCEPEEAARLGAAAREHSDRFTWRAVAERTLRALRPARADASGWAPPLPAV